jgi:2-polyprenyl-6-hydroxyphenyl methylase/3-demethylubiquinone-9 3-methyltransferase
MNCPICSGKLESLGKLPFDYSVEKLPIIDDTPMEYHKCTICDFIGCLEMLSWTSEKLGNKVYNIDYIKYDPDYVETRPTTFAKSFGKDLKPLKKIMHLDYGSGSGLMSKILKESYNWNSTTYDPYSSPNKPENIKYNLITAIEVFEHSLDIDKTIKDIKSFLDKDGLVLFTTQLANKNTNLDWWYIMPRNGHISLLSEKSLKILAKNNGLFFQSINENLHVLQPTRNTIKELFGLSISRGY